MLTQALSHPRIIFPKATPVEGVPASDADSSFQCGSTVAHIQVPRKNSVESICLLLENHAVLLRTMIVLNGPPSLPTLSCQTLCQKQPMSFMGNDHQGSPSLAHAVISRCGDTHLVWASMRELYPLFVLTSPRKETNVPRKTNVD